MTEVHGTVDEYGVMRRVGRAILGAVGLAAAALLALYVLHMKDQPSPPFAPESPRSSSWTHVHQIAGQQRYVGRRYRVLGVVVPGSAKKGGAEFRIRSERRLDPELRVAYPGKTAATDGLLVIVTGRLESRDTLRADSFIYRSTGPYGR